MRYLPCGSDSTLTVMWVFALRACTNAPRNGPLSGPVTVPLIVAAGAASLVERSKRAATTPIDNHVNDRMASSRFHVLRCLAGTLSRARADIRAGIFANQP